MKLTDYVARFLSEKGIRHVFGISGGASIHLIHSVAEASGIELVCSLHEQAGAMAADGYSRATGNMGVALATSGPGATNLITGVAGAYYDSVPMLCITGQVSTFRMKGDTGVRQVGFQETECVEMFKSITNYAVMLDKPEDIKYELEKAFFLANYGRPGPVVIDIPDNFQREKINVKNLVGYKPLLGKSNTNANQDVEKCINLLKHSKRPILILGWGIHLSGAYKEVRELIDKLGMPFVPTWAVADILESENPLYIGTFGTHGTRYSNFAVQNSDLILSIGSRLDTKATGSPISTFARGAKKIVVDIDNCELNKFKKFGLDVDLLINADAKYFIRLLIEKVKNTSFPDWTEWIEQINIWKSKYPICPEKYYLEEKVNPYVFVKELSKNSSDGDLIILDTGCTLAWTMQAFDFKKNQRLYHDFNNTAMGWALPASIGASFALDKKPITCLMGDGSILMNIQELATVIRHKLPIRIFLLNNKGHSMVQQTQDQWLNSKYYATSVEGGLPNPDFSSIAKSFGFKVFNISLNNEIEKTMRKIFRLDKPVFCHVNVEPHHRVLPQVKFGRPNEDPEPLLARDEFLDNMIIEPIDTLEIEKIISPKDSDPFSGT